MGRAIVETVFDICYLVTVVTIGILMIVKCKGNKQYKLFGIMAVVLGAGDAFHLIPRAIALCAEDTVTYVAPMGIGKLITSITMTAFYVLLYYVWRVRYNVKGKHEITVAVYLLSAARIILCAFPQNGWTDPNPPLIWGIARNIPFALLGILIIVLFAVSAKKHNDKDFKFMWLTIVLSFAFYIPVVVAAHIEPLIGLLMIPKTCAYVWTVVIGFMAMKKANKEAELPQIDEKVDEIEEGPQIAE